MHRFLTVSRWVGAWVAGLCLCLAPPGLATAQVRSGPSVSISLSLEPDSLDPTMAASAAIGEVVHYNVLEGLTRIEENGDVRPLLAQSWSQDASALVHVFKLRRGVRFHDGAVLDADTVRFSFERAKAPGSTNKARKALFDNIARIDTPDAHTVVLNLERPDVHLLFRLGESTAVILHPASAGQAASHPVGTGPYRFGQWDRGQSITLLKADTYRHAAQVGMERAVFHFIHDAKAQEAAFRSGSIDLFFNLATQDVGHFQGDSRYQVLVGSSGAKGMVAINHRRKPLDDVRVRRAITHAIDREGFIRKVLEGRGRVIGSHFAPTDQGYVHLAGQYPYAPERARSLLREAGVATPLRLTLTLPPTPYAREGGPLIAADLAKVGIELRLETVEWSQWLGGVFKGQFDLSLITHVESLDYLIYTDPFYYFGYDSPEFLHLAARHALAGTPRERNRVFAQMQRHLAEDAANAWIFAPQVATVARKGLRGVWMNYPLVVHDIAAMRWE